MGEPNPGGRWTDGKYFWEVAGVMPGALGLAVLRPDLSGAPDEDGVIPPPVECLLTELDAGRASVRVNNSLVRIWRVD